MMVEFPTFVFGDDKAGRYMQTNISRQTAAITQKHIYIIAT